MKILYSFIFFFGLGEFKHSSFKTNLNAEPEITPTNTLQCYYIYIENDLE